MTVCIELAEQRAKLRAKHRNTKPQHTYIYKYRQVDLHQTRVPCYIDQTSANYYWITYWNPEYGIWGEASVNKSTQYVERIKDESTVDRTV